MNATPLASRLARSIAAVAALALGLGACAIFQPAARPAWTTYLLELPRASADAPANEPSRIGANVSPGASPPVLRVATVESTGGYDTARMAYCRSEGEIEYFANHRWAEAPAAMLMPLLVAGLERTGRFATILVPTSRASGDLLLETQLLVFRCDFARDGGAAFHLTLRATLVASVDGSVLGSRSFDAVEPMDEASPGAGAKAAQRAAERAVGEVAAYCTAVVATPVATDGR